MYSMPDFSNKKFLIYQDDKQYIILHENNTYEVIPKSSPDFQVPDDIFITTPRGLKSAIKGYIYDNERKKKAYQLKKEKLKTQQQEAECH
jgi:hypothetical protein